MVHVVERIHPGLVVDSEGDVRPEADYTDAMGDFVDVPGRALVERVTPIEADVVAMTDFLKTGPLETRVDDWLDVNSQYRKVSEKDACNALGIDYDALQVEVEASRAELLKGQRDADHLAARSIIEAHRAGQLAKCSTESQRIELRARFRAEDELRKRP